MAENKHGVDVVAALKAITGLYRCIPQPDPSRTEAIFDAATQATNLLLAAVLGELCDIQTEVAREELDTLHDELSEAHERALEVMRRIENGETLEVVR